MSAATWLRLASALAALQFVAHTVSFVRYVPTHGPAETAVVAAMQANRFSFGGFERSYWELYYGYGLLAAFSVLLEAVLFWQLATLAASAPARVRPVVALFVFANLVHALLCARFFFLAPIVMDAAVGTGLVLAWFAASGRARPERGGTVVGGG